MSRGIPACSEYLQVGGASQAMQREPPTAYKPPCTPPLPKTRAYEWPEYNKRHFFPLLPPSCEPFFTSLRISGNVMYVYLCEECACVCVSRGKKRARKESTLVGVHQRVHVCEHALCISFWVCSCMYGFLACQYEMCVSHVERDSGSLRPGPCLGSQPRVM